MKNPREARKLGLLPYGKSFEAEREQAGALPQEKQKLTAQPGAIVSLSPKIAIQSISTQPAPLKVNAPFELTIQFLNAGNLTVTAGQQYSLSCKVISGGPACPLPSGIKTINQNLQSGAIHFAKFANLTGPAGSYELTVKMLPEKPGEGTKTFTATINPEVKPQNVLGQVPVKQSNQVPIKR